MQHYDVTGEDLEGRRNCLSGTQFQPPLLEIGRDVSHVLCQSSLNLLPRPNCEKDCEVVGIVVFVGLGGRQI